MNAKIGKHPLFQFLLLALIGFACAKIALSLRLQNQEIPPFWPVAGIATGAFIRWRLKAILPVFVAILMAFVTIEMPWLDAIVFTGVQILGYSIGAFLLQFFQKTFEQDRPLSGLIAILSSALISSLFIATSIAMIHRWIHPSAPGHLSDFISQSFLSLLIGNLVTLPFILEIQKSSEPRADRPGRLVTRDLLIVGGATALSILCTIFFNNEYLIYFLYLPILFSGILLNRVLIFLTGMATSSIILASAILGFGTFTDQWTLENLVALQVLVGSLALTSIEIAAITKFGFKRKTLVVILLGWFMTGTLFFLLYGQRVKADASDFSHMTTEVEGRIQSRLASYIDVLNTAASLSNIDLRSMPADTWSNFAKGLDLDNHYPGITNIQIVDSSDFERVEGAESKFYTRDRLLLQTDAEKIDKRSYHLKLANDSIPLPLQAGSKVISVDLDFTHLLADSLGLFRTKIDSALRVDNRIIASTFHPAVEDLSNLGNSPKHQVRNFTFLNRTFETIWTKKSQAGSIPNLDIALIAALGAILTIIVAKLFATTDVQRRSAEQGMEKKNTLLLKQLKLWKTLTESSPVGIFQMNGDGHTVYCNPKWESMMGIDVLAATPSERWALIHPDDQEPTRIKWSGALKNALDFDHEYRIIRPDGSIIWIHVTASQIHDETGELEGIVGIGTDISERTRHEHAMQRERLRSIQSSKMANLGEMAAGIAHEINNPLALINAITCRLRLNPGHLKEEDLSSISTIESTALRIGKIVKGLLSFARNGEADPFEPCRLSLVIQEVLDLCRERFQKNQIELKVSSPQDCLVVCRSVQISQILVILLNNAFDAVVGSSQAWIRIKTEIDDSHVKIFVSNSGEKISLEINSRIFEPFFTTKTAGVGLGLSIAQGLALDHHGELVLNQNTEFTEFVLKLPINISDSVTTANP